MNDVTTEVDLETQLVRLEGLICDGLNAYESRNQIIVELVSAGMSQAEVTKKLNAVRDRNGVQRLTPAAVTATCKRLGRPPRGSENP